MTRNISEGTSKGMLKWWAKQPYCYRCGVKRIKNKRMTLLCAKCGRESEVEKSNCVDGKAIIILTYDAVLRHRTHIRRELHGRLLKYDANFKFEYRDRFLVLEPHEFDLVELV